MSEKQKTILLEGFSDSELSGLVTYIKQHPAAGKQVIFASITDTSRKWTVEELLEELAKEHAFFKGQEN